MHEGLEVSKDQVELHLPRPMIQPAKGRVASQLLVEALLSPRSPHCQKKELADPHLAEVILHKVRMLPCLPVYETRLLAGFSRT